MGYKEKTIVSTEELSVSCMIFLSLLFGDITRFLLRLCRLVLAPVPGTIRTRNGPACVFQGVFCSFMSLTGLVVYLL